MNCGRLPITVRARTLVRPGDGEPGRDGLTLLLGPRRARCLEAPALVRRLAHGRGGGAAGDQAAVRSAASSRTTRRVNASYAARVSGPGAAGSSTSSTTAIGMTSRTDEAMKH